MGIYALNNSEVWSNISDYFDKSIMQLPLTVLMIPLVFVDKNWTGVIPITLLCDVTIHIFLFYYQHYITYSKVKENFISCITGNLEIVDEPITKKLINVMHKAYRSYEEKQGEKPIKIYKNSNITSAFNPTTIPDLNGVTTIHVHKDFNSNSFRDIVFLGHELGHTFHSLLRQEKYAITIVCSVYQILLFIIALNNGSWLIFSLALLINVFLIYKSLSEFDARLEMNADLFALQNIETEWGSEKMHEAAFILLDYYTCNSIEAEKNGEAEKIDRTIINKCIKSLTKYINTEDLQIIIQELDDKLLEVGTEKNEDKRKNILQVMQYLQNVNHKEKSFSKEPKSGILIIFQIISFMITILSVFFHYRFTEYQWNWMPIIISVIIFVIILIVLQIISFKLWIKKETLLRGIGI